MTDRATTHVCEWRRPAMMVMMAAGLVVATVSGKAFANGDDRTTVVVVVGAPGTDEYGEAFAAWAKHWKQACEKGEATFVSVGLAPASDRDDLETLGTLLKGQPKRGAAELWVVLIGHGTFDGREAKFNLRGPDVSAGQLADWLDPVDRPVVVINCSSASAPFVSMLSRRGRVIVSATKSGYELNFARFGEHLAKAIGDPGADLDKDGQTSLLEAFLAGSRQTLAFYNTEGRLATEHALIDDNGDGRGTPAEFFRGVRVIKRAKDGSAPDGRRAQQLHLVRSAGERAMPAEQRAERDALELRVAELRDRKGEISTDAYYAQLEPLLVALARLYERNEQTPAPKPTAKPPAAAR